ncbi:MAG TPA: hypothetical protein VJN92_20925 [Candidatus Acidoferrum sp.]|nr:hypothetical protein [Candidatus Acidoferrum sp.]
MPAGPGPIGFAAFTGVKFLGYSVAASVLTNFFQSSPSAWLVGLVRTGIGLVAGTLFGGIWLLFGTFSANRWPGWAAASLFFGLLIPIRLAEWSLLIHFFFDRGLVERARDLKLAAAGSVWSFVLDGVGIVSAFVIPGGFWVC